MDALPRPTVDIISDHRRRDGLVRFSRGRHILACERSLLNQRADGTEPSGRSWVKGGPSVDAFGLVATGVMLRYRIVDYGLQPDRCGGKVLEAVPTPC